MSGVSTIATPAPRTRAFSRLLGQPSGGASIGVLALLYLAALLADFLAPYPYDYEVRSKAFHPPVAVHFFDGEGRFHLRPFVYASARTAEGGAYEPDRSRRFPLRLLGRTPPYRLWNLIPLHWRLLAVDAPATLYLLGADWNGRDILSRIVHGARISLSVGLLGALLSFSIGTALGILSGLAGGAADTLMMRTTEVLMSIPAFFLLLALRAVFPLDMPSLAVYGMMILLLSLIGWAGFARMVRNMTLSIQAQDFIASARTLGAGPLRVMGRHVLPNVLPTAVVWATLSIPSYILAESALSLLGLGISEPLASWGNMLNQAMRLSDLPDHPWILWPGFFIFAAVAAFNLLGEALREELDPRASG